MSSEIDWDKKVAFTCTLCGFISFTPHAVLDGHVKRVTHVECPRDGTILAYVTKRVDVKDFKAKMLDAANTYRETVLHRADGTNKGAPWWYGWIILEAFQAGASWMRNSGSVVEDNSVAI